MPELWQSPIRLLCAPASAAGGTWEATGLPSSGGFLENSSAGQQEQSQACCEPKKTGGSSASREDAIGTWPLGTQPPLAFLCRAVCPPSPPPHTPVSPKTTWVLFLASRTPRLSLSPRILPAHCMCGVHLSRIPGSFLLRTIAEQFPLEACHLWVIVYHTHLGCL